MLFPDSAVDFDKLLQREIRLPATSVLATQGNLL
jgi:hypothetical protein